MATFYDLLAQLGKIVHLSTILCHLRTTYVAGLSKFNRSSVAFSHIFLAVKRHANTSLYRWNRWMVVWDNVTSLCTANPFCWLLGDNTVVPEGFRHSVMYESPTFSAKSVSSVLAKMEDRWIYEPKLAWQQMRML